MNPPMPGLRLPIFEGMRKYSWLALPAAAGIGLLATRLVPGPRPDGTVVLPSGWRIHPAGRQVTVGTLPLNLVVLSDGQLAVPANGYGANDVRGVDPAAGRVVWTLPQHAAWVGLARSGSAGHDTLWVSGGKMNTGPRLVRAAPSWTRGSLPLPGPPRGALRGRIPLGPRAGPLAPGGQ